MFATKTVPSGARARRRPGLLQNALRSILQWPGTLPRRRGVDAERHLADATDRFALERREREWSRGDSRDGSLLGR